MFIIWIVLLVIGYYWWKEHKGSDVEKSEHSSVEDVLDMRYVKGEIDEETYIRMKNEISK